MRKRELLIGSVASLAIALLLIELFSVPRIENVEAVQVIGASSPWGVAIGDYNNDGSNEIVVAEISTAKVTVYKSDLTTIVHQWTGLNGPSGVAIGDYDNDGGNDLAFAEYGGNKVTVYKNDLPTPTLLYQWTGLSGPAGVAIGDYNNDGLSELAFAEYNVNQVTVYKNDLPTPTLLYQWTGLGAPVGVAIGDYNNDGRNDLAFAESVVSKVTVYKNDLPTPTVLHQWTSSDGLNSPFGVAIGDYDDDGLNDIAFTETSGSCVTVYDSDSTTVIEKWVGLYYPYDVAIGDYNNDGLNDLAFSVNSPGRVVVIPTKPRTVAKVAEPTIVTLRGTLTDSSGYPIMSGSIKVTIKDSLGTQVWQDTFDACIDNGKYNLPLGTKTTLSLIKGQIYNAILEVDAYSATFVSADIVFGDNNPSGDLIKFVAG